MLLILKPNLLRHQDAHVLACHRYDSDVQWSSDVDDLLDLTVLLAVQPHDYFPYYSVALQLYQVGHLDKVLFSTKTSTKKEEGC